MPGQATRLAPIGEDAPHEAVPAWMRAFELSGGPAVEIAQPECDPRRSADSHVAVENDPIDVRPVLDECDNLPGVLLGEEYIGRIAALGDIVELEAQHP